MRPDIDPGSGELAVLAIMAVVALIAWAWSVIRSTP